MKTAILDRFVFSDEVRDIIENAPEIIIPESRKEILDLAIAGRDLFEVGYEVPGKGFVVEATVTRCKNGLVVNYPEPYMRRRDPNALVVGDNLETDKPRFRERFGKEFEPIRQETFEWLKKQELILLPFMAGGYDYGYPAVLIAPKNAGFFVGGLADLQFFVPASEVPENFKPKLYMFLAPPFRHTHFDGKQVVVHYRHNSHYEIFSYNLYPGPSAKKGVYGFLLHVGEKEKWVTAHASAVKVITPYENELVIMHEGASGGGKSEILEEIHREPDGRIKLAENIVTGEKFYMELKQSCVLMPVADDMFMCHPKLQTGKKLVAKDAEAGWFIRVDHITEYGSAPDLERLTIHPPEPLIFLNIYAVPNSTALIWEHIEDEPGKPCPNPRVIIPKRFMKNAVSEPVKVDVRSFGVRTPPCTKEKPTYGIVGLMQILPPALAWLWRLVAPRGHANPSIVSTKGMTSEGVGSFWPFSSGKMVRLANILLEQIIDTPETRYILVPNQYIGAYKVGFMPEWIAREYLSRRGGVRFRPDQLVPSKCSLLGFSLKEMKIEGNTIPKELLQPHLQSEVGEEAYEKGAQELKDFFKRELKKFLTEDLNPVGREIIQCCLDDGSLDDYLKIIPMNF
ncbi:hypothetical protein THMA_0149 [Thermotoga maritima MSB8]|uniref:DUF4914 domain-containing protein n=3 Tax=Thermotoga TaxID=2335 RepID=Q9WY00_THEMA|nr:MULTISPECIES: DUF4914 family protein [Thermotoga]KUK23553.1 MAG: Uncharacterized protein XD57_0338 [Thermotoga petrophila]MDK2893340.1 hypothetical protein [Thermotoga sp.]AAD35246.1 hypothetical protein TM_0153 [Thermotoga maritima MSB8]ABQ46791.1 hypothetical protein Tpet_0772 [Thermotoga petrophila RKU-1]ACB09147.1 conserved hypothetical protein [Thermotoga sp. RQ2]